MLVKTIISLVFITLTANAYSQEYSATYRVTFVGEWSQKSHPTSYPANAHFSNLIGNTHNQNGQIWQPEGLASPGMEVMAETGGTNTLSSEIDASIKLGHSKYKLTGPGPEANDIVSFEIEVTYSHPLVSLVTMIAPSPDWFVGVHGVSLIENEFWVAEAMYELLPYDSGTDSGTNFTSSNQDTNPAEPIHLITTSPLDNGVPLGVLFFERLSVTGVSPDVLFESGFD